MRKSLLVLVFALGIRMVGMSADARPQGVTGNEQQTAPSETTLSNKDVVEMFKAGLSPEILVAKIKASVCNFDTSPAALQELKAGGVPDTVILGMVDAPRASTPAADTRPVSPPPPAPQPPELVEVRVPDGTPVEVELKATVSSEDVEEGSVIDFIVVQPVKVNDAVVIERGAPAKARVEEAKKARHWGRAGMVSWSMQDAVACDGWRIPLRFSKGSEGGGSSGKVAGAVIATSLVFWPAAPFWGLKKGKAAILPAGKRFEVFVHGETTVKVKWGGKPAVPTPEKER